MTASERGFMAKRMSLAMSMPFALGFSVLASLERKPRRLAVMIC